MPEELSPTEIPISTYGAQKLASETLICAYCHMFDFVGTVFRFANVVGPHMTHGVSHDFTRRLYADPRRLQILGDGMQSKPYIHADDVVAAMLFLQSIRSQVTTISTSARRTICWCAISLISSSPRWASRTRIRIHRRHSRLARRRAGLSARHLEDPQARLGEQDEFARSGDRRGALAARRDRCRAIANGDSADAISRSCQTRPADRRGGLHRQPRARSAWAGRSELHGLDNLSNGKLSYIEDHLSRPNITFLKADILDREQLIEVTYGHDLVGISPPIPTLSTATIIPSAT